MKRFYLVLYSFVFCLQLFAQQQSKSLLGGEWRFVKDSTKSNTPNDAAWEKVKIPHTWNIEDGQAGVGNDEWQSDNSYYRGPATYTKRFTVSKIDKNCRTYLHFEAVSQQAEVFLNGQYLGKHSNAFTAFTFDISEKIKKGENFLVVKATNAKDGNIAPLGGDFTLYGGIYRNVWLVTKNNVSISPLHYSSCGVYLKQTKLSDNEFQLEATSKILNQSTGNKKVNVVIDLLDVSAVKIANISTLQTVNKKSTATIVSKLTVKSPVLWQGTKNPYLYKVFVKVYANKQLVDTLTQFIGFRKFEVDPLKGAFLNGKPYKVRGVNKHQDFKGKGYAISNCDVETDLSIIKEMGANGIRLAHYPHSAYTYSLSDKYGFLIWAEMPLVNSVHNTPEFHANTKTMLKEFMYQNYNNASIVMWSLGNELGHRKTDDPLALITELNQLAKEIDPTRYTIIASNGGHPENSIPDLFGVNSYPGWYNGAPEELEERLVARNKSINNKGLSVSEYGAGASIKQHQQFMTQRPVAKSNWHPEEWQAILHEKQYMQILKNDWVWGSFLWNMFDFASAGRNEGDTVGINDKGLVTYDRMVRKDAFYFYKANWNSEPMAYITSRRHTQRDTAITNVKVYSNCEKVELFVNGIKQNIVSPDHCVFNWENITLNAGRNEIKVIAMHANKEIIDTCEWYYIKKD